jgi:hypothetical protein
VGFDATGNPLGDYTFRTRFAVKEPNGRCTGADCGATRPGSYTVTGTVIGTQVTGTARLRVGATPLNCAPSASDVSDLQVTPGKGATRTQLRITAKVNPTLTGCPLRIFFGGSGLGSDVTVRPDGSISEYRSVPNDAKRGAIPVRLVTAGGQVLAAQPFQVTPKAWPLWLLLVIGLLLLLAVLALLGERARRQRWARQHVRAEPHPSADDMTTVDPDPQSAPTFSVRLQPHGDAGTQTLKEGDR